MNDVRRARSIDARDSRLCECRLACLSLAEVGETVLRLRPPCLLFIDASTARWRSKGVRRQQRVRAAQRLDRSCVLLLLAAVLPTERMSQSNFQFNHFLNDLVRGRVTVER